MDQSKSCTKEDKWRANMIISINETDCKADTLVYMKISKPTKALVDVKPQSYRPHILTIGPLHEMLSGSPVRYNCKALCVNKFMRGHEISDVEELMKRLFYDPSDLHNHYSGLPGYSSESLQLLVTVDTIFIREFLLFLLPKWEAIAGEHDHFHTLCYNDITYNQVMRDLFVMGNQIPMPFLMKLIEEFPKKPELEWDELQEGLFYAVAINDPFLIGQGFSTEFVQRFHIPDFRHCTHLLDCLYVWVLREPLQKYGSRSMDTFSLSGLWNLFKKKLAAPKKTIFRDCVPTASQLSKSGIWFKGIVGSISVMHYNKRRRRFGLPRLVVYHGTEDILRNLIAHEQTSKVGGDFTKYAVIMDSLIDTTEDVTILTKAGVIENHLGSDERMVKMWNDMCTNVSTQSCKRWDGMIRDIHHHYENPWRPMFVECREKYFSRPWLTISLLVAFILLLFSALQTAYTIAGYYKPPAPAPSPSN